MIIRTTVAFDAATAARLERLAKRWGVSKSETLRRALENAEQATTPPQLGSTTPNLAEIATMSPADALAWLRDHSLVTADQGAQWRTEMQQTRQDFAARP